MALSTTLLAALGLTGVTQALARRREARAARQTPPTGRMIEVEGCRLHLEVAGQGPDLVMIHGSSGNLRDFSHSLTEKLVREYRVIMVDRPGLGWSDPHPDAVDIRGQARLIQGAVAQLGAECPIVLGQSYGGAVALAWGVTLPGTLSAIVPVAAPCYPWETGLGWYYATLSNPLGNLIGPALITAFVPDFHVRKEIEAVFAPQTAPEGYADHFGPDLAVRRRSLRWNARQRGQLLAQIRDLAPHWAEIDVPIEVIHGTRDDIVSHAIHAERLARDIGHAHLTLLDGIGHMPHHVAQDDVIAAIHRAALRAGLK